jgi:hypothetical protein
MNYIFTRCLQAKHIQPSLTLSTKRILLHVPHRDIESFIMSNYNFN